MPSKKFYVVTPWHKPDQRDLFLKAWGIDKIPEFLILQQDVDRNGCAQTKNSGIEKAIDLGAEIIIVLDDDCFPSWEADYLPTLNSFAEAHIRALQPQPVELFEAITDPPSRGTPYFSRSMTMPVAASMGFWTENGDYDAAAQLVYGAKRPMKFNKKTMFWRFFPLSGMNLAFRASWWPAFKFIDVPRFDDIWMGYKAQQAAYRKGYCFNLCGPTVRHSRQSNVWANLKIEAENLERNETIWQPTIDIGVEGIS